MIWETKCLLCGHRMRANGQWKSHDIERTHWEKFHAEEYKKLREHNRLLDSQINQLEKQKNHLSVEL